MLGLRLPLWMPCCLTPFWCHAGQQDVTETRLATKWQLRYSQTNAGEDEPQACNRLWFEASTTLQRANAELILAANRA